MNRSRLFTRRNFCNMLILGAASAVSPRSSAATPLPALISKSIPSSEEPIPAIGLGSWITFNVGGDPQALDDCTDVMRAFFDAGGRMIDSSPMYGSSQSTIGTGLQRLGAANQIFATDKVWTTGVSAGKNQIAESQDHWGVDRFSLLQVHNLLDWEQQLETLFEMKQAGRLGYVGITTSHGRRHSEVERILERHPLDFLQLTYNISHRSAETRLLPLAREKGVAVITNRPFDGGRLVRKLKKSRLPLWAEQEGFRGWADFLLKFNISHPAVTCAIPATSRVDHLMENMQACSGTLPGQAMRKRMSDHVATL